MVDFRKITPKRRTQVPTYSKHTYYKEILRKDFHCRCGYCGDHDFFRETYYEVDHFVPQKWLVKISPTKYSNLVYSCRSCNNYKRAKWPSKDENTPNNGVSGFIDPCDLTYPKQFDRLIDGSIYAKTELGEWMWSALNFGNPSHRLKWNIEEVKYLLDELDKLNINDVEELKLIRKLESLYRNLEDQLRGKPNFM